MTSAPTNTSALSSLLKEKVSLICVTWWQILKVNP